MNNVAETRRPRPARMNESPDGTFKHHYAPVEVLPSKDQRVVKLTVTHFVAVDGKQFQTKEEVAAYSRGRLFDLPTERIKAMNAARRKAIEEINVTLATIKSNLDDVKSLIEELQQEEQDAFDNLPESFQQGEKGEKAQAAIDNLEQAATSIDEFDLDGVANQLTEAANG